MSYGNATASALGSTIQAKESIKGTAVDSLNANLESLTSQIDTLTRFASRISDSILGVVPADEPNDPRVSPVIQSTQDHVRALENAFDRLSSQINRLG